jgi:hypothetical protein
MTLRKASTTSAKRLDVGFRPKSHESRTIPMPASLVKALQARRKAAPESRWIFVNTEENPDNRFLRKLKQLHVTLT